jgi:hypothetical protein
VEASIAAGVDASTGAGVSTGVDASTGAGVSTGVDASIGAEAAGAEASEVAGAESFVSPQAAKNKDITAAAANKDVFMIMYLNLYQKVLL